MNLKSSPVIILDNQSNILKKGLSSKTTPSYKMSSLIGFSFYEYNNHIFDSKLRNLNIESQVYLTTERNKVIQYRSLLELTNPTKEGFYTNEEDIVNLLDNLFINDLNIT